MTGYHSKLQHNCCCDLVQYKQKWFDLNWKTESLANFSTYLFIYLNEGL